MNIQCVNPVSCKANPVRTFKTVLKDGKQLTINAGGKDFEYMLSKDNKVLEGYGHHNPKGFSVLEIFNKVDCFKDKVNDAKEFMQEFFKALSK